MKEYWHGELDAKAREEATVSEDTAKVQYRLQLTTACGPTGCDGKRVMRMTEPEAASWNVSEPTRFTDLLCRPSTLDKWKYNGNEFELIYHPFPGEHRLLVEEKDISTNLSYEAFWRRKIHRTFTFAFLCFLACVVFVLLQVLVKYRGLRAGVVLGLAVSLGSLSLMSVLLALGFSFPKTWSDREVRELKLDTSKILKNQENDRINAAACERKSIKIDSEWQEKNPDLGRDTHCHTIIVTSAEINTKSRPSRTNSGFGLETDHGEGSSASHATELWQSRNAQDKKRGRVRLPPVEQKGRQGLLRLQRQQQQQQLQQQQQQQ